MAESRRSSSAPGRTAWRRRSPSPGPESRCACSRRADVVGGGMRTEELTLPGLRATTSAPRSTRSASRRRSSAPCRSRSSASSGSSRLPRSRIRSTTGRRRFSRRSVEETAGTLGSDARPLRADLPPARARLRRARARHPRAARDSLASGRVHAFGARAGLPAAALARLAFRGGPRKARRASAAAGSPARVPNRANASGCEGNPKRREDVGHDRVAVARERLEDPRVALRIVPERRARLLDRPRSSAAVPSSNGCASAAGDSIHSTPSSVSGTVRKNGDATPSGWIAEQTSCA